MINTNIGLVCLLSVSLVSAVERYKYRLLTPTASPSPTRPPAQRQYQARISRQLGSREDSTGPYLNKESFFSAGFLEDLFGLGRPAEPTVSFQGKREIAPGSQPSHFPSFFAPVRSPPSPPAFLPSSPYQPNHQYQPYHNTHQSPPPPPPPPPPPVQQYHHTPPPLKITRNDNKTPYKYTVKGSSTHYVDNNKKKTPGLHPVQPSHGHFTPRLGSSFLQSSGQDYPGQPLQLRPAQVSAEHKVKPFRHHGGLKQQQHQPRPALFSSLTQQNVILPSSKPSMQELLNNIDQHQSSTTPRLPGTDDVRSFQNFEVTPSNLIAEQQQQHQPGPKKDVFQIFQKVAEQFSLVTDINQNVGEMKNSIESTTPRVDFTETQPSIISENPPGTTGHPDLTSAGLLADDSPGNLKNVVIQADKKNAKSFSSASTATSSSGLIREPTTRKSESSAVKSRRITERVVETESAVRSPSERRRKPQKPSRNSVKTGFTSFPYRDKSSKYNAKLMVKDEGQEPRSASELVSLEDKQGRKEETLKKLLAIAGEEWSTQSEGESPVRRRQREKFECPEPEGHFPDPGRCDVYYRCTHGRPSQHSCGAGLLWNTETGQCDWEAEVVCESLSRRPRTTA